MSDNIAAFLKKPTREPKTLAASQPDGLSQDKPSSEIVRLGQEAMARQRRGFDDCLAIADALQFGRAQVMRDVHTNKPRGGCYEKAIADWLIANGFKEIDKGARSRLLECLEHRVEIKKWRHRLTEAERFRYNHPNVVLRKWKASTVVPDPNAAPRVSAYAKLQTEHAQALDQLHRAECEIARGGGDLWNKNDRPRDIARAMRANLKSAAQVEHIARELLAVVKAEKAAQTKSPKTGAEMECIP